MTATMRTITWRAWGVHLLIWLSGTTVGLARYEALRQASAPPIPLMTPRDLPPRNQRPELVDRARLQAVLRRMAPRFRQGRPTINHVDHALRLWGVAAPAIDDEALSGVELRELLLDHRVFTAAWGERTKPLLILDDDDQGVTFRTRAGPASASHVDHTLAGLAEVGTPLDYPVLTPRGERPLAAAFTAAFRDFSPQQLESEWSTLVWLHYLPQVTGWTTTEGQRVTWDQLAERLMRERWNHGVCYGQHRLYVLAAMLIRDAESPRLSPTTRARVTAHLVAATRRLEATQAEDGLWNGAWSGTDRHGPAEPFPGPLGVRADRLLATGHVLEWWAYAPPEALPSEPVLRRTIAGLLEEFDALSDAEIRRFYPFLTHAARGLLLWHGARWPSDVLTEAAPSPNRPAS